MSTVLHLVCMDHDPPLVADSESGQHLSDLPQIRADLAAPLDELAAQAEAAPRVSAFVPDPWYFRRQTIWFRRLHPACRIGIRDEYGAEHPTTDPAAAPVLPAFVSPGAELIATERRRQVEEEGYDAAHDACQPEEMAHAAACYAIPAEHRNHFLRRVVWPWRPCYWKPTPDDRVRELVKAGALIAAEIDRILAAADGESAT